MAAITNILVFISIATTSADIVSVIDLQQIAAENLLSKAVEPLPQGAPPPPPPPPPPPQGR